MKENARELLLDIRKALPNDCPLATRIDNVLSNFTPKVSNINREAKQRLELDKLELRKRRLALQEEAFRLRKERALARKLKKMATPGTQEYLEWQQIQANNKHFGET